MILEFDGNDRHAVNENHHVDRQVRVRDAKVNLARNGKNVPVVITLSRFAQLGRKRVIHVKVRGIVIVALADDVDDATLGDFVLKPVKERMTDMRVLEIYSSLDFVFLRGAKE